MELVEVGGTPLLLVGSSNFDLRFNAGRLFAFSAEALAALVPPTEAGVFFRQDFGDAITGSVRVDSFSGELSTVELAPGGVPGLYALSPSRSINELTVVRIDPDGSLSCRLEGSNRNVGLDCSDSHRIQLLARDAYSVSVADFGEKRMIAVGSLGAVNPIPGFFAATVSLMTSTYLEARISGALEPISANDDCNVTDIQISAIRGIGGLIGLTQSSTNAELLSLSYRTAPALSVNRYRIGEIAPVGDCIEGIDENIEVFAGIDLRLDNALSAFEGRGLIRSSDGRRAYASVRFVDSVDTTNAAIVVLDISDPEAPARIISAVEVGEELGRPNLDERPDGGRLLYIGDRRTDQIYVVNVITDQPQVVGRISGQGIRDFGDATRQVRVLDQPAHMAFFQDGERRLAFVSNFTNSTIGVLDITDPDPRRHRVIARLGRDLDPQGESESP